MRPLIQADHALPRSTVFNYGGSGGRGEVVPWRLSWQVGSARVPHGLSSCKQKSPELRVMLLWPTYCAQLLSGMFSTSFLQPHRCCPLPSHQELESPPHLSLSEQALMQQLFYT